MARGWRVKAQKQNKLQAFVDAVKSTNHKTNQQTQTQRAQKERERKQMQTQLRRACSFECEKIRGEKKKEGRTNAKHNA